MCIFPLLYLFFNWSKNYLFELFCLRVPDQWSTGARLEELGILIELLFVRCNVLYKPYK